MASEGLTPSLAGDGIESLVPVDAKERNFGRYSLRYELAAGGMATVYLARARGPAGFDRAAAIKRIHPHLAKRREFVEMFLDLGAGFLVALTGTMNRMPALPKVPAAERVDVDANGEIVGV